jgi:putative ABC transport system permease protein
MSIWSRLQNLWRECSLAQEDMREARFARWPDDLARDVRHAVRVFGRQPFLTSLTVLTLSLGIGANAAIFSTLNAALFRALPFPAAARLVSIVDRTDQGASGPTIPECLDVRAWTTTLENLSFFDTRDFQINGGSEPVRVFGARVEPGFLTILGARPALGRLFNGRDGSADGGGEPVVVLSDGLWRRNFGGDPNAIGRTLVVNGVSSTIVGILPAEFAMDVLSIEPIDLYVPYPMIPAYTSRTAEFSSVRRVFAIGRIKASESIASTTAELATIAGTLTRQYPALYRAPGGEGQARFTIDVEPLHDTISRRSRPVLLMLAGAVGLVLLIACVNAAQFLLAQAIEREPEVALRRALGASGTRLIRQFLSESLLLAGTAAALGLVQAFWLTRALRMLLLPGLRVVGNIGIDLPVLGFTAVVAMATSICCGLVPTLRFSSVLPHARLDTRPTSRSGRSRQFFIAIEVALSLVLLVQAGLLLHSLQVLQREQTGFSPEAVTVMRIRGMAAGSGPGEGYRRYLERIAAVPGIEAAAITSGVLPGRPATPFTIVGRAADGATLARQSASYQIVSPSYFSVLRIPLRDGRTFSDDDVATRPPVAIINESLARQYWPGESPLGRQIHSGLGPREATMTIVGVVGNVRPLLQSGDAPQIYVSYLQQSEANVALLLRSRPGPAVPVESVKAAIWSVEPRQAVFDIRSLDDILWRSMQGQRVIAALIGAFAVLAFVMSVGGIFTVVSYLTSRRVKEIALRRAIGASNSDVMWLLAAQTFRWAVAGMAVGVAGAFLAQGALRAAVAGVVQLEPSFVAGVAGAYLLIVAAAMTAPGLRALRVDPAAALRAE